MSTRTHGSLQSAIVANIADARKKEAEAVPEVSAEEIIASLKRELRSVVMGDFGTVYYHYPLTIAEQFEIQEHVGDDGRMTAQSMVRSLIALARNSDGSQKFKPEHFDALMTAPASTILAFARAVIHTHKISEASVEKK